MNQPKGRHFLTLNLSLRRSQLIWKPLVDQHATYVSVMWKAEGSSTKNTLSIGVVWIVMYAVKFSLHCIYYLYFYIAC